MSDLKRALALAFTVACKAEDFQAAEIHVGHAMDELYRLYELAKKSPSRADRAARGSSNNGTASGDSGLKNARLPLLDVRTSKKSIGGHKDPASPQSYRAERTPVLRHITGDYGPLMTQPETALSHSSWTI